MARFIEEHVHITVAKGGERHRALGGKSMQLNTEIIAVKYGIQSEYTHCNYGGMREWLICPYCGERRMTLYYVGKSFMCRTCGGLIYYKQGEAKSDRGVTSAVYDYYMFRAKADQIWRPYYNGKLTKRAQNILKHLYISDDSLNSLITSSVESGRASCRERV